jgi:hypothetical protein
MIKIGKFIINVDVAELKKHPSRYLLISSLSAFSVSGFGYLGAKAAEKIWVTTFPESGKAGRQVATELPLTIERASFEDRWDALTGTQRVPSTPLPWWPVSEPYRLPLAHSMRSFAAPAKKN